MHHLLTMKALLHFKRMSYLPSKIWSAKEQLALTTIFYLHFSSHSVLWPSGNYYPYSTHPFLLLIVLVTGGLPSLFNYWKLRYLPLKLHLSAPSVLIMCWSEFPMDMFLVHSYLIYISLFLDDDNVANYADSTTHTLWKRTLYKC